MEISLSVLGIKENIKERMFKFEKLGINYFHIDVIDGKFAEKNTIEDMKEKMFYINNLSNLPVDIHIMAEYENLNTLIDSFGSYFPNSIAFHIEAFRNIKDEEEKEEKILKYINKIYDNHSKSVLVINPETDKNEILKYLPKIYKVLVMTVKPGDGGRPFEWEVLEKIKNIKKYIEENNLDTYIEVDGAVSDKTVNEIRKAGADIVSVGSYLTNETDENILKEKINILKNA